MRQFLIVSVLPTVDGGQHASSLEKQQEYQCRRPSNELLSLYQSVLSPKQPDSFDKNKQIILPGRTQELLVYRCLDQSVCMCYCATPVVIPDLPK